MFILALLAQFFHLRERGLKNMARARQREVVSCELAFLTAKLVEICIEQGILWSIENPQSSMLWELLPIQFLSQRPDTYSICFPCAPLERLTKR